MHAMDGREDTEALELRCEIDKVICDPSAPVGDVYECVEIWYDEGFRWRIPDLQLLANLDRFVEVDHEMGYLYRLAAARAPSSLRECVRRNSGKARQKIEQIPHRNIHSNFIELLSSSSVLDIESAVGVFRSIQMDDETRYYCGQTLLGAAEFYFIEWASAPKLYASYVRKLIEHMRHSGGLGAMLRSGDSINWRMMERIPASERNEIVAALRRLDCG